MENFHVLRFNTANIEGGPELIRWYLNVGHGKVNGIALVEWLATIIKTTLKTNGHYFIYKTYFKQRAPYFILSIYLKFSNIGWCFLLINYSTFQIQSNVFVSLFNCSESLYSYYKLNDFLLRLGIPTCVDFIE